MSLDMKIIRLTVIKSLPINYLKKINIWSSFYTSFEFDVHLFVKNNINNHVTGPICNITHTHRDRHACTHTHTHTHTRTHIHTQTNHIISHLCPCVQLCWAGSKHCTWFCLAITNCMSLSAFCVQQFSIDGSVQALNLGTGLFSIRSISVTCSWIVGEICTMSLVCRTGCGTNRNDCITVWGLMWVLINWNGWICFTSIMVFCCNGLIQLLWCWLFIYLNRTILKPDHLLSSGYSVTHNW